MTIEPGFGTKAVHAGQEPDPTTGAIMTPVYMTSTYVQESPGVHKGYEYSRTHNPTRTALEKNLAALEGGKHGLCFSSGLGATNTVLDLLAPGDHVVAGNDLYGGTYRIMKRVFERYGLTFTFTDTTDPSNVAAAIRKETKLLWIESPSNPLLRITDLAACASIAKARGVTTVVDNTFASPFLQQPISFGADIVLHSMTKYLGGHSDVVGGALVLNDDATAERLRFFQNAVGATPGPMDCFLVLRGTKTLHLRMERHCANAARIASWLAAHPKVSAVHYPGLASHPQHALAARQMRAFGGMVSFEVHGGLEASRRVAERVRLFALAESLGGVESLLDHPAIMTHASIPAEERRKAGLADGLLRLSVGVEDADDLVADLAAAIG
ncbi:MAG: Cystathionine beta-lyase [Planctomycetes bacterium]|nr:Cystathionine beta-lyase [Planctomycetota bacterium]